MEDRTQSPPLLVRQAVWGLAAHLMSSIAGAHTSNWSCAQRVTPRAAVVHRKSLTSNMRDAG